MSPTLRCQHCGGVIGVYEPLVALIDGHAHETSRANELHARELAGDHYHSACYEIVADADDG